MDSAKFREAMIAMLVAAECFFMPLALEERTTDRVLFLAYILVLFPFVVAATANMLSAGSFWRRSGTVGLISLLFLGASAFYSYAASSDPFKAEAAMAVPAGVFLFWGIIMGAYLGLHWVIQMTRKVRMSGRADR